MNRGLAVVALALLWAGAVRSEEYAFGLQDVTVVQDGHGVARVLFRAGSLPASDHVLVERAVLTVPYAGAIEGRSVELRVCPVTAAWAHGADWTTPFDNEIYARSELDLTQGSGVMSFDLTVAFQAMREHGLSADGFVLTLGSGRAGGIPVQDLARLAGFTGASLRVTTTNLPSGAPPQRWIERHQG
ncbi:MAG: hypothetical protein U0167_10885 [bacterium]